MYSLLTFAGCSLTYLTAINLFLYSNGLQLLFKSTNTVNATYQSAFSVWPGVVHVRALRVVFQDKNVQFSLDIERVKARISLTELISRRFHATRVEGSGAAFRMRHRVQPETKDSPWIQTLPPIPEFNAPAVFEPTVPEPPIPDSQYNLWTVHLENVDVGVKEVWVQFVRYLGNGRARGAFQLVPARNLWVGPASLDLDQGRVVFGSEPIGVPLSGRITCKVDWFDVGPPQGREVFRYINGDIVLKAQRFSFMPLVQFFASPETKIVAEPGTLNIRARVRRGHVVAGSQVEYESGSLSVAATAIRGAARGVRVLALVNDDAAATTTLHFERVALGAPEVLRLEESTVRLNTRGDDLTGDMAVIARELDVAKFESERVSRLDSLLDQKLPFSLIAGRLLGSVRARDTSGVIEGALNVSMLGIRAQTPHLGAELEGDLQLDVGRYSAGDGSLKLDASGSLDRVGICALRNAARAFACGNLQHVRLKGTFAANGPHVAGNIAIYATSIRAERIGGARAGRLTGSMLSANGRLTGIRRNLQAKFAVKLDELYVRSGDTSLRFRPELRMAVHNVDAIGGNVDLDAALRFSGWSATFGDDGGQCSSLMLPDANIEFAGMIRAGRPSGRIRARVKHASLAWGADFRAEGDIRIAASAIAPETPNEPTLMRGTVQLIDAVMRSGQGSFQGWEANMPNLELDARAALDEFLTGSLKLQVPHASGRIGAVRLTTSVMADIPNLTFESSPNALHFSGRFRLEDMQMGVGTRRVEKWWAEIDGGSGLLIFRSNLDVSANFHAVLRDATPALAVLEGDGKVPSWLADVVPLRRLQTEGVVERRCRMTDIEFTRATGGPLVAQGRLQSTSDIVRGAFLVRLAAINPVSLGVEVGPPDAGVSPLVGEGWLREHLGRLGFQARSILSGPCRSNPQRCLDSGLSSGN